MIINEYDHKNERMLNMSHDTIIVQCADCGVKNRIPIERLKEKPVCGKCKAILPMISSSPVVVTDATFDTVVTGSALPVFIDFWAPWCSPCRMMEPSLKTIAKKYAGKLLVVKMNVDENPMIAGRFTIMSIPTLMFMKNGNIITKIPGALSTQELEKHIQKIV